MAKHTRAGGVRFLILIIGIIFACGGFYFLGNGIHTYINQFEQDDWCLSTATVINVNEYYKSHKSRSKSYDIIYQYEAENNIYTNTIYRTNSARKLGDTFEIKYNPAMPSESTQYTKPTFGIVVSGFFAFLLFGYIGFRMIKTALYRAKIQWNLFPFRWKNRN